MLATAQFIIIFISCLLSKNKAFNTPGGVILFIILNGFGFAIWKRCVKADLLKCYSRMHKTAIE